MLCLACWPRVLSDQIKDRVRVMVFDATFNNIWVISWRSVLLVEVSGVHGENRPPVAGHWQTYHIMLYRVYISWPGFELTTSVVIDTRYIGSYKSNYHTITTAPNSKAVKLVFFVSPLSTHNFRVRTKTGWLEVNVSQWSNLFTRRLL